MNARERFIGVIRFGETDRVPLTPGSGRESTREAWYRQGLPKGVSNPAEYAYRLGGGREAWPGYEKYFHVNDRMIPEFEEKVLERKERSQVVQDWKGNICEIGNEYTVEYLRNAADFVTRRWIKCPVESRADWEDMKRRYDADDPARFPEHACELGRKLAPRDWPFEVVFPGPFWQLREWLGFENLCVMFYDDPGLLKEMIAFWEGFIARLLEKLFQYVVPDSVLISEDMAYKSFSMISPEMTREFLLPTYILWGEIIRGADCPVYSMDSDGFIGELIPLWIEAGVDACFPVEVAAGNDIAAFRRDFGSRMAFRGGVDKRAMAKGGDAIVHELDRLAPVIRDGGFIPGCDHAVPPDVSWPDYVRYVELLAKETGWL